MASEILINRLYQMIDEIARLGGEQERTSIVPGILVADASPSDLPTGYIKIVNPRDGTYVPCLTVSGLVVSDNDLVNVLFTKGTEPIALSQSAGSPSSSIKVYQLWESDFGAVAWQTDAAGHLSAIGAYDLTTTGDIDGADITASGDSMGDAFGYIVKNTSGAAATAGDAGYLNENNEYKTTTTASFQAANPVVVLVGGANNADIYVTSGPGRAIVNYVGSAPTTGQFVVFSTTAGKVASAGDIVSPAILARARANGAGGTVEVELLLRRTPFLLTSTNETFFVNNADDSDFVSTIAAAGVSGDKVYYNAPSSGNVNCINPFFTTDLMKIVLRNTTKAPAEEAFIIDTGSDGGGNFIQVSNSADVSGWVSTETITTRSQTNTSTIGTSYWFDLEITSSEIPELAVGAVITVSIRDISAVGEQLFIHPYEADATAKRQKTLSVNTAQFNDADKIVPLIQRRVCVLWTASGSGTARVDYRVREVIVAA